MQCKNKEQQARFEKESNAFYSGVLYPYLFEHELCVFPFDIDSSFCHLVWSHYFLPTRPQLGGGLDLE